MLVNPDGGRRRSDFVGTVVPTERSEENDMNRAIFSSWQGAEWGGHTLLGPPYGGVAVGNFCCVRYGVAEILTDTAVYERDPAVLV